MAHLLEPWTERTPTPTGTGDLVPMAESAASAAVPALPDPPALEAAKPERERGPFLTYLCMPWSYGDRMPGEAWHRWKCRLGRHVIVGGHTMQLGGTDVFVARQCRWCGAEPG